jgi:hypothetical protein
MGFQGYSNLIKVVSGLGLGWSRLGTGDWKVPGTGPDASGESLPYTAESWRIKVQKYAKSPVIKLLQT